MDPYVGMLSTVSTVLAILISTDGEVEPVLLEAEGVE
jgi:hypothetical protein